MMRQGGTLKLDRRYRAPAIVVAVLLIGWAIYANRWGLGHHVVRIADPVVRRWAQGEVERLSDGAYLLASSHIVVDEAAQRVSVDSVIITTDLAANSKRDQPLPALTLRFRGCALSGIDIARLTAGNGLHVASAGCDSVAVSAEVPQTEGSASGSPDSTGAFLRLQGDLELSRDVPFIRIDTVAFPHVALALGVTGSSGRRTAVRFDRLAVRLDSLHYDPKVAQSARTTLLSRDVTVSLEGFQGSAEAANRLALTRFSVGLANRTLRLEGFEYEPLPGPYADSLGFTALSIGRLALDDVNWRRFLTTGNVSVGRMTIDSATVQVSPTSPRDDRATAVPQVRAQRPPVEAVLRAIGRIVTLDTFMLTRTTLIQNSLGSSFRTTTSLDTMLIANVAFGDHPAMWDTPTPIGRVTLDARGVLRRDTGGDRVAVRRLHVNVADSSAFATDIRVGPEGSDADFVRRNRWRADRIALSADSVAVHGADLVSYLRLDRYNVRRADVSGFIFDIYSDKRLPSRGRRSTKRTPQQAMGDVDVIIAIDTVTLAGRMSYRERSAEAEKPGEVRFDNLRVTVLNLSTDPLKQTSSTPMRVVADSRLMGKGAFHVDMAIPLLARDFSMTYSGKLGAMPATAFTPFLLGATKLGFSAGELEQITFNARVNNGVATGTVVPRWNGLKVEVPGVARSGPLGGIRRALAKFAANEFLVQGDNTSTGGKTPKNGAIRQRWTPQRSLPQFLWISLRDAIIPILKR
ncbi:MAG: hypothetical protein ABIR59_06770 [Gemmatimonadales bacterium]